jgi:D-glycero-D-manno-heptose 1,7-bisphosphate phosphatase
MYKNRAFFLDRDGVIIKNVPYLNTINGIEFLSGVKNAIKIINKSGYKCIIITNQSAIARGIASLEEVYSIHQYIRESLLRDGAIVDAIYFCPHLLRAKISKYAINCNCRKPKSGMLYKAARDHKVDLANSIMVGDKKSDIIAGGIAGCKSFQLYKPNMHKGEWVTFMSLLEVVNFVIHSEYDGLPR